MSHPQDLQPCPGPPPGTPEAQPLGEALGPQPQRVAVRLPLYRPVVTWVLLAVIVVVFLVEMLLGGSTDTYVLIRMGAKYTPRIAAGEYWRLFTSMFLHVGVMHLAFNGYALFIIGTELERLLGPGRFLSIYLLSGLFGSLASYAFSDSLAAGASGAIFGIIGALAAFFIVHRERLGTWGARRLGSIALILVLNLVWGFSQPGRIDNLAHVGGLLAGVALGWALTPRYELDPVRMQVVDRNHLGRYWPALGLAVLLLLGGTALVTAGYRGSLRSHLYRRQQAIEQERWEEAAAELEQTIAQDPSWSASHWNLDMTCLELERYADARASLEAYAELTPSGPVEVRPYLDELASLGY